MGLTAAQRDRAVGAMVGLAVGDALGAGYEFGPPVTRDQVAMIGGGLGPFAPGEWTDDTSMAVPILRALSEGEDLLAEKVRNEIASAWVEWSKSAPDVGATVRAVLQRAERPVLAADLTRAATGMYEIGGRAAGNGSLMRTTPIVLGYLDDPAGLSRAARTYSDMTHGDPAAGDACVLWNHAQRFAIVHGGLRMTEGLRWLPKERRQTWSDLIDNAIDGDPKDFAAHNGWVVRAFQAACAAIHATERGGPEDFEEALRVAVAAGGDTDTVAAIAGGLAGARWGVSAIPLSWRRGLQGWPGITGQDLVRWSLAALDGRPWPDRFYDYALSPLDPVRHPHDSGLWLGDVFGLRDLPSEIDAVVSLCRLGGEELPEGIDRADHIQVWLIDSADPEENRNLGFVAQQAVGMIADLRDAGRAVYLHCVHAHSRTPFIAALYGREVTGRPAAEVMDEVLAVLPDADPNPAFRAVLGVP